MSRRKSYSSVDKLNDIRKLDINAQEGPYKIFQCINPGCNHIFTMNSKELNNNYSFNCPECEFHYDKNEVINLFDYDLVVNDELLDSDTFSQPIHDYILLSEDYKYCKLCETLKPLSAFHKHSRLSTGRQSECASCKTQYNSFKNGTRTSDQHRESAQKRRLYMDLTATTQKIDSNAIAQRFENKCFNCNLDLTKEGTKHLDHTLPVYYLYPLTTNNATLLCSDCNGSKSNKWPSHFYNDSQLRKLSVLTGFNYNVLAGSPVYNPESLLALKEDGFVDSLLNKYAKYLKKEIIPLRNRILKDTDIDMFKYSKTINDTWIEEANSLLQ